MNFYNENNPKMAAWLRKLIEMQLIAPGIVDERSITEIKPDELTEYDQCHFFAGVGGWPLALRLAGWDDKRKVWTGSCPCQPFSVAGKAETVGDERHLWPAFHRLIAIGNPPTVFGEQVAGSAGYEWLAGIRVDLEGSGYAVGASDLPAACVGAPHPRQRIFWVAESQGSEHHRSKRNGDATRRGGLTDGRVGLVNADERGLGAGSEQQVRLVESSGESGGLGDAERPERRTVDSACGDDRRDGLPRREEGASGSGGASKDGERLANPDSGGWGQRRPEPDAREATGDAGHTSERMVLADSNGRQPWSETASGPRHGNTAEPAGGHESHRLEHASRTGREERERAAIAVRAQLRSFADSGAWRDWESIGFTDGKTRRIESGTEPLVDGLPKELVRCRDISAPFHAAEARQMRLHGYGNAIVPEAAAQFIQAFMETQEQ